MNLTSHFIVCLILTIILYPFFGLISLFVFIGGFFVDVDHYFWYVAETGKYNPIKCNNYFQEISLEECRKNFLMFHTKLFDIISILFAIFTLAGKLSLLGLITHRIMDYIWCNRKKEVC